MRHFAFELKKKNYQVVYVDYEHNENLGSFFQQVQWLHSKHHFAEIHITKPGEYRLLKDFQTWQKKLGTSVILHEDHRFIASAEFSTMGKKQKKFGDGVFLPRNA
ncbi:MAG: cryptochrome/photolyase family protein [Bdellovibrionota bacterium]